MAFLFITGCFFSVSVFADLGNGSEDFEEGWGDWWAENGVWEIGVPTVGPESCHSGTNCAGTVLDGNYPDYTDSRLITPSLRLPTVIGDEELYLRFWHWFAYSNAEGWIQVSVYDETLLEWSDWVSLGNSANTTSSAWSLRNVDLTAYAGKKVKIAFYHTEISYSSYYYHANPGWYIDDIEITGISSEGCTQDQLDAERAAGRQECVDDPASYGIDVDGNYQEGYDQRYLNGQATCEPAPFTGELPETIQSYLVLTDGSAPFYLSPGSYVQSYGSGGSNTINVKKYARVQFQNFIGANVINIEEPSSEFTCYRSGATVYLNSLSGTLMTIAATQTAQTLCFKDGSLQLLISNENVTIGTQIVSETETLVEAPLDSSVNSENIF